jgi:hypothetical protein
VDTRRQSVWTVEALKARRKHAKRGHLIRNTHAERPYAPPSDALRFRLGEVTTSMGES